MCVSESADMRGCVKEGGCLCAREALCVIR